jgi:hypothetical protein
VIPKSLLGLGIRGVHVKQLPLDQPTYLRAKWSLENARVWGTDPVEQLHELGLILTPAKERQLKLQAMEFLLAEIEGWRPAEFIRRTDKSGTGATPADLHRRICEFVQDHIDAVKAGG